MHPTTPSWKRYPKEIKNIIEAAVCTMIVPAETKGALTLFECRMGCRCLEVAEAAQNFSISASTRGVSCLLNAFLLRPLETLPLLEAVLHSSTEADVVSTKRKRNGKMCHTHPVFTQWVPP